MILIDRDSFMKMISRSEEIILATILKLEDNAYGVSIREQIHTDTGERWSFASIYQPLDKLARKEYVTKTKGESTAERGGKSKFFYRVTPEGRRALLRVRETVGRVWAGVPRILPENGK
jgi:DNA-binding PadR family transcriptional regulator